MFTLGPDRITRARWFLSSGPFLSPPDGGGGGGGDKDDDANPGGTKGGQHDDDDDDTDDEPGDDDAGDKGGTGKDKDKAFDPITSQADLDRIIDRRVIRLRGQIAKDVRTEIEAEARRKEAAEQGDYKTLYEELQGKHEEMEQSIAARDLKDRKQAIAKAAGLPAEMYDRLQGESDEDLKADAKAMAKLLATPDAPEIDTGNTAPGKPRRRAGKGDADEDLKTPAAWGLPT